MIENSPSNQPSADPSRPARPSNPAKSAIPFVQPSEPIISGVPAASDATQTKESEDLKIPHDHTEAISVVDYNTGLQEAFAHRKEKQKRKKAGSLFTKVAALAVIAGGAAFWYYNSPDNQDKVTEALGKAKALASQTQDQTDVGKVIETYDSALDKIEVHKTQTTAVTTSLTGASESELTANDIELQKLLQETTGMERTALDRDNELHEKFDGLAKKIREKTNTERPEPPAQSNPSS